MWRLLFHLPAVGPPKLFSRLNDHSMRTSRNRYSILRPIWIARRISVRSRERGKDAIETGHAVTSIVPPNGLRISCKRLACACTDLRSAAPHLHETGMEGAANSNI